MNKFYNYHKDRGRDTEGCWQLKYLIMDMMNDGKLKDYLLKMIAGQQSENPRARKQEDEAKDRDINRWRRDESLHKLPLPHLLAHDTIYMLVKIKGLTSRKCYTQEILYLDHEEKNIIHCSDGMKVKYPHSDPLLITVRICDWDINQIYIDTGSNTNMIFKELLEKLRVSLS